MAVLSFLYAHISRARRRAHQRPGRQRSLRRPVVSVGNLRVGGTGKTPTVAHIARLLVGMGERPAILSRGYARRDDREGVVIVSDWQRVRADLDASGDEPLMLARAVEGAAVLVSPDRFLAGLLAEHYLGATVHVLDDGFQHLSLRRDVDLVIVTPEDVADPRTLPSGRLREPLSAAAVADALLIPEAPAEEAREIGARLGVARTFSLVRQTASPMRLDGPASAPTAVPDEPVFAVAGVARPERFFQELARDGWSLCGTLGFRDHHRYCAEDIDRIVREARQAGATAIVTTEKDLMRLLPLGPPPLPLLWVPLSVTIEPAADFREWLAARLRDAAGRAGATRGREPDGPPGPGEGART